VCYYVTVLPLLLPLTAWLCAADHALEKSDLERMAEALKRVQEEMRTTRARFDKLDADEQRLRREVADLERDRGLRPGEGYRGA
jgi:septal ring factor EnvC (AmiA/AmiB activator)